MTSHTGIGVLLWHYLEFGAHTLQIVAVGLALRVFVRLRMNVMNCSSIYYELLKHANRGLIAAHHNQMPLPRPFSPLHTANSLRRELLSLKNYSPSVLE